MVQVVSALSALSLAANGPGQVSFAKHTTQAQNGPSSTDTPRIRQVEREPTYRDSLKSRESFLKGKDGSRRRQRWENDRLLSNPHAQPPLPSDWEVRPTHPVHVVPYYLAPLWDAGLSQRASTAQRRGARKSQQANEDPVLRIPKELRATFKRAKSAKGLLQDIEEQVRSFLSSWQTREREFCDANHLDLDSEDEEIVFVGRSGQMNDLPPSPTTELLREMDSLEREILVMQNPIEDQRAKFGRWLVHNIATYYGLQTWSVTVGDPAWREAYVGMPLDALQERNAKAVGDSHSLPRPLWVLV
ncbi:MAG: hypothetical protein M1814_001646 [Vezdaea aestivalis]|nr:MAG: hypothetical protein M1814_001646 [Vezdaea aestivalis]